MVKKKLNKKRLIISVVMLLMIIIFIVLGAFFSKFAKVSKDSTVVEYIVENGLGMYQVFDDLESKGLIKSAFALKVYSKIKGGDISFGTYTINKNMNAIEVYDVLTEKRNANHNEVKLTFREGRNVRQLISDLTSISDITEEEILTTLTDTTYLKNLINEYWFLTDDILDKDIYYSLEGYLYPNTYMIYKNSSFKSVVKKMLDEMDNKLTPYKDKIENSNYTVHELLTLASIVEQEGPAGTDRYGIAGVFTNRLNDGWSLGSCVTTYYAAKVNLGEALYQKDIDDCTNKYNTRCMTYIGLPVGPICNPSIDSIVSSLNPTKHNYYYFEADKNNKTYFNETYAGHLETIKRLEKEGLWNEIQ